MMEDNKGTFNANIFHLTSCAMEADNNVPLNAKNFHLL